MASFDVKLDGADALIDKLGRMADNVRKQVSLAVEATALDVQDEARRQAPVDTGTLMRSIQVREVDDRPDAIAREVFTNVPYAARQEFGFVGTDRLGRGYNQPGRFYMTKGAAEGERVLPGRVTRALQRAREAS